MDLKEQRVSQDREEEREEGRESRGILVFSCVSGFIKGKNGTSGLKSGVSEVVTQSTGAM